MIPKRVLLNPNPPYIQNGWECEKPVLIGRFLLTFKYKPLKTKLKRIFIIVMMMGYRISYLPYVILYNYMAMS